MENDPLLTPPPKIWNFPYVLSLFFLKASLMYKLKYSWQKDFPVYSLPRQFISFVQFMSNESRSQTTKNIYKLLYVLIRIKFICNL